MEARKHARPRKTVNHRTLVGRERRERTQARILESAVEVFARKGADGVVIDDFIRAAQVARGTFYNYYKSTDELLEATAKWLEDDLIVSIEAEIGALQDPVLRMATGVRLWLQKAHADPVWSAFVVRLRRHGALVERQLAADLRAGLASGRFRVHGVEVGRDLVVGTVLEAMQRMARDRTPESYRNEVVRTILQGLGVPPRTIARVLARPLPVMRRTSRELAPSGA